MQEYAAQRVWACFICFYVSFVLRTNVRVHAAAASVVNVDLLVFLRWLGFDAYILEIS